MLQRAALVSMVVSFASCASDERADEVVATLTRADEVLLQTRPTLVAEKYQRMARDSYGFYRGALALFRHDWEAGRLAHTRFELSTPVWGLGDAHPENFGLLVAADGVASLEPNDLDSADRVPPLFDLRRLTCGLALATTMNAPEVPPEVVGAAAARGWALELRRLASGEPALSVSEPGDDVVLADLFKRSARDLAARAELANLTRVDGDGRHFVRGQVDPEDPTALLADVAAHHTASLAALLAPLGANVLDVVRERGSGVASWPRLRLLVLLAGADGHPPDIVEVKEETESPHASWYAPPLSSTDVAARVEAAARRAWSRPDADPHYFCSVWQGVPVQVRTESEANKGVKVSRLTGNRSSRAALETFATTLGRRLSQVHAATERSTATTLSLALADAEGFALEEGAWSAQCGAQVEHDFEAFRSAVETLGPTLGFPTSGATTANDFTALLEGQ